MRGSNDLLLAVEAIGRAKWVATCTDEGPSLEAVRNSRLQRNDALTFCRVAKRVRDGVGVGHRVVGDVRTREENDGRYKDGVGDRRSKCGLARTTERSATAREHARTQRHVPIGSNVFKNVR